MDIALCRAGLNEATIIHEMQVRAFLPLLNKYLDYETSPANEPLKRIIHRLNQTFTDYYLIRLSDINVGAIRIVRKENQVHRVSPILFCPNIKVEGSHNKYLP